MELTLVCLLHPRQHVKRMEEIDRAVQQLGWCELETYGIVVDKIGYYVGCTWVAEKVSIASAREELDRNGILPSEYEVCPTTEYPAARAKRVAEGYYDDMDCHA